jgi:hypothetical protein
MLPFSPARSKSNEYAVRKWPISWANRCGQDLELCKPAQKNGGNLSGVFGTEGEYRNAVASGPTCVTFNWRIEWLDPTLPRYGTDLINVCTDAVEN